MTELLVRFLDGTAYVCEQQHAWRSFVHGGESFEWCIAIGFVRSETPLDVVALRCGGSAGIVGATVPKGTDVTEVQARALARACGGAAGLRSSSPSTPRPAAAPLFPYADAKSFMAVGMFSDQAVTNFLSQKYRVPTINLEEYVVAPEILILVARELCERHVALPVSRAGSSLIMAMADPNDDIALSALRVATGFNIEPVIATTEAIRAAIARYYPAVTTFD